MMTLCLFAAVIVLGLGVLAYLLTGCDS